MKYKLAIFDLDGTILDTLEDLHNSVNYALQSYNLPLRTREEVRLFVGNGIRKLIERSVPRDTPKLLTDKIYQSFVSYYSNHCHDKTKPYEGISAMLSKLKDAGYGMAVVSNKADAVVRMLCPLYFGNMFDLCVGAKDGVARKPAGDALIYVMRELGCALTESVYIGDSEVDIQTIANCGIDGMIVTWGFRNKEELLLSGAKRLADTPLEVLEWLL